uniref:Uncharacterized protein n=1 Tax=Glycine max TaxID=3847 RepID=K7MRS5_SOYBN
MKKNPILIGEQGGKKPLLLEGWCEGSRKPMFLGIFVCFQSVLVFLKPSPFDIEKEIRKEVDEAIAKAKESQMPEPSDLFTNVYVKGFGVEACGADRKELRATLP